MTTVRAASGTTIALVLIFLTLLLLTNEVRYQGCVSRIDNADLINATSHSDAAHATDIECHRIPFVG